MSYPHKLDIRFLHNTIISCKNKSQINIMVLTKMTTELIDKIIEEFRKNENQERIKINIIDPLIYYILDRLYPYIFVTAIIFILILLITIMILTLIIKEKYIKT